MRQKTSSLQMLKQTDEMTKFKKGQNNVDPSVFFVQIAKKNHFSHNRLFTPRTVEISQNSDSA